MDLKDIPLSDEPLFNEYGEVNMEGILDAIDNLPDPTAGDPEWEAKKDQWTFKHDITGYFAMWAIRQSPYVYPEKLEKAVGYLDACLEQMFFKNTDGMIELSLREIENALLVIFKGSEIIKSWNTCKKGDTPELQFSSCYSNKPDPDHDFIDIHALFRNVCVSIRDERRKNAEFDRKFDAEYATMFKNCKSEDTCYGS